MSVASSKVWTALENSIELNMRIIKLKHFFFILRNIKRKVRTIAAIFSMFYFLVKLVSYSKRNEYFTILGLEKHEVILLDANDANRQGDSWMTWKTTKKKFKESNEVVDHTMDKKLAKDLGFQKSYCLKPECYDMRMN